MFRLPYLLGISVIDTDNKALSNAKVTIESPLGNKPVTAAFSEEHRCFISNEVIRGKMKVKVTCKGYEAQERELDLEKLNKKVEFQLGKKGDLYLYIDDRKIPLRSEYREIGAIVSTKKGKVEDLQIESKLNTTLGKKSKKIKTESVDKGLRLVTDKGTTASEIGLAIKSLRETEDVIAAGPIMNINGDAMAVATNIIFLELDLSLDQQQTDAILKKLIAASITNTDQPNRFILTYPETIGWEIFAEQDILMNIKGVKSANINFCERLSGNAVIPNEFHWPSQWDKHTMLVNQAWEKLELIPVIGPDIKYGDPRIVIAVVDNGIKSAAGLPANEDFKDYVTKAAEATLNNTVAPPTVQIQVSDDAGFNVNHLISIGNESGLKITAKSVNTLTVEGLRTNHLKDIEIINQTAAGVFTFLSANANAAQSVFQVTPVVGGPGSNFLAGYTLSIGSPTSNNWEVVKIIAYNSGTGELTTTPVTLTHPAATVVVQGRKTVRLQDFDDTNFVHNNDNPNDAHGTSNASVAASKADNNSGVVGIAPNVQVFGSDNSSGAAANDANAFIWLAGVDDYISTTNAARKLPILFTGADVITTSLGFGELGGASSLTADITKKISKAIRRGRNGRGVPIFFSAGNDNEVMSNTRWSVHKMVMAISASSKFYRVQNPPGTPNDFHFEHKSYYSNFSNVTAAPDKVIAFSAPANNGNYSDHRQPELLRIYAADFPGEGNVINKSDGSTTLSAGITSTKLNGALAANSVWVVVDSVAGFSAGDWIKIGDIKQPSQNRNVEWVEIKSVDVPGSRFELYATAARQNQIAHPDDELVSILPKEARISRSILPADDDIYVDSVSGFKANDWIRIGLHKSDIFWKQLDSISSAASSLKMKPGSTFANVLQIFGKKSDRNLQATTGSATGTSDIEVNVDFPDADKYFVKGQAIRITTSIGNKWFTIASYAIGSPLVGYTSTKLTINGSLSGSVTMSAAVFIPKSDEDLSTFIIGSTEIDVVSSAGFAANSWVHITTPAGLNDPKTPRLESTHIHQILPGNKIRISGPHFPHPAGTPIHRGVTDYNDNFGGTSAATPQVAGAAALLLSANPNLTWIELRELLREHAVKILPTTLGFQPTVPPGAAGSWDADVAGTRPQGVGRWLNSDGVFLFDNAGVANPAAAGNPNPYYSDWFGHGRINIDASVIAAKAYNHNSRDLMLRDYLIVNPDNSFIEDPGTAETDTSIYKIDSPDIWVRQNFALNGDSVPDTFKDFYYRAGPHQNANYTGDRSIYIRPINRGNSKASLQAWVRVYLCLTSGLPDHAFASHFDDENENFSTGYQAGKTGTYFLKEIELFDIISDPNPAINETIGTQNPLPINGGIPNGEGYTVHTKWDAAKRPPLGTHKRTYVIAEVLPYDGPLTDAYIHRNSNISYKRVAFTNIKITDSTGTDLPKTQEFNPAGTSFNYKLVVSDWEYLPQKHIQVKYTRTPNNGTAPETALYTYNGASWSLNTAIANFTINPPVITPGAVGMPDTYTFSGTITCVATDAKVCLRVEVMEPDVAEENHLIPVKPLTLRSAGEHCIQLFSIPNLDAPADDLGPAKNPRLHIFTDIAKLKTQIEADSDKTFGTDNADPEQKFHITTMFSANIAPDVINAYAVTTGRVFIQQADNDRVNLFLKPLIQSGIGYTPVKYFVYRGLRLTDFLAGSAGIPNTQVRAQAGASQFIQDLYQQIADRNNAQTPVGTDTLSPKAFGWDPVVQTDPEQAIDDYFFSESTNNELAVATKGMILGTFKNDTLADEFGFEIMLDDGTFIPSIAYSRVNKYTLTVLPGLGDFKEKLLKEQVLSFVDPASYIGMHYFAGMEKPGGGSSDKMALYTDMLTPFLGKNRLYVDIRNENNYSYNFYNNYQGSIDEPERNVLRLSSSGNYSIIQSRSQVWPIMRIFAPSLTSGDYGVITLKLLMRDNIKPVLYVDNGVIVSPKTNSRFIDTSLLTNPGEVYATKEFSFMWPQVTVGPDKRFVANQIKFRYLRGLPTGVDPDNDVVKTENYLDNIFGPLESILQNLSIDQVNTGTKTFTLDGKYDISIKTGDVIKVEESPGSNDGIYTVASVAYQSATVKTHITVNETIASAVAPLGRMIFSYHLWNVDLPTRWFSGSRKVFVDTINEPKDSGGVNPLFGFGFVGNSGQAIDNGRVVFYTAPLHYLKRGNETRAVNQINLWAGMGDSDSIWTEVIRQNPRLKLSATTIKLTAATYLPLLEFEQTDETGGNPKDENFLALCITEEELNQVKKALFLSNLSNTHSKMLKLKNVQLQTDTNLVKYLRYELWITGWKLIPGAPDTVDYEEVTTHAGGAPAPVYVYTLASNPLIFCSKDFSGSEPIQNESLSFDEGLTSDATVASLIGSDPTMNSLLNSYQSAISGITDNSTSLITQSENTAIAIFNQAVSNAVAMNARPWYWAILKMRALLKQHPWTQKQRKKTRTIIESIEQRSRGLTKTKFTNANPAFSSVNFTTAKKILLIGFDPLIQNPKEAGDISAQSVSASIAFAAHNTVITQSGQTGAIQSVIFPLRYNDYSNNYYEEYLKKYLSGSDKANMIVLLGNNTDGNLFDVDWLASKTIDASVDNENVKPGKVKGPVAFYATKLPVASIVTIPAVSNPRIYFDQSYSASSGNVAHPSAGGIDNNIIPASVPSGSANSGSSGLFIYNKVFYDLMNLHAKTASPIAAGMISLPRPGGTWSTTAIQNELVQVLKKSLGAI
jgi:Subtilase family